LVNTTEKFEDVVATNETRDFGGLSCRVLHATNAQGRRVEILAASIGDGVEVADKAFTEADYPELAEGLRRVCMAVKPRRLLVVFQTVHGPVSAAIAGMAHDVPRIHGPLQQWCFGVNAYHRGSLRVAIVNDELQVFPDLDFSPPHRRAQKN
jgi:hypothetical protein